MDNPPDLVSQAPAMVRYNNGQSGAKCLTGQGNPLSLPALHPNRGDDFRAYYDSPEPELSATCRWPS